MKALDTQLSHNLQALKAVELDSCSLFSSLYVAVAKTTLEFLLKDRSVRFCDASSFCGKNTKLGASHHTEVH